MKNALKLGLLVAILSIFSVFVLKEAYTNQKFEPEVSRASMGDDKSGARESDIKLPERHPLNRFVGSISRSYSSLVMAGVPFEEIYFDKPTENRAVLNSGQYIFGVGPKITPYVLVNRKYLSEQSDVEWVFNANINIPNIAAPLSSGNGDIVAYLIGVNKQTCQDLNDGFERASYGADIPQLLTDQSDLYRQSTLTAKRIIQDAGLDKPRPDLANPIFAGKSGGCFKSNKGDKFVYFQIVVPR